jgi:hypothetical protein
MKSTAPTEPSIGTSKHCPCYPRAQLLFGRLGLLVDCRLRDFR